MEAHGGAGRQYSERTSLSFSLFEVYKMLWNFTNYGHEKKEFTIIRNIDYKDTNSKGIKGDFKSCYTFRTNLLEMSPNVSNLYLGTSQK